MKSIIFLGLILILFSGCATQKHIPDGDIDTSFGSEMPDIHYGANDATLKHYFDRYTYKEPLSRVDYFSKASSKPSLFEFDLKEFKTLNKELEETSLVSYLFYENGKVIVDKKSPLNRLGKKFDDHTQLRSMSVGKSMVSYVLGHAIAKGYISSVDEKMNWPVLKGTLYYNQPLINLLNMQSGVTSYMHDRYLTNPIGFNGNPNNYTIQIIANNMLKNSKPGNSNYYYNGLDPNVVINYIIYKIGGKEKFNIFLNEIFQNKVKVQNEVFFLSNPNQAENVDNKSQSTFYASRYDYLRIAISILNDWNKNTKVGQYLKEIYQRKIYKHSNKKPRYKQPFNQTNQYGGFFHINYRSYSGNDKIIIMDGRGGQMIWINFDKKRIVVTNSVTINWDWKTIVADVIENGLQTKKLSLTDKEKEQYIKNSSFVYDSYNVKLTFKNKTDECKKINNIITLRTDYNNIILNSKKIKIKNKKFNGSYGKHYYLMGKIDKENKTIKGKFFTTKTAVNCKGTFKTTTVN